MAPVIPRVAEASLSAPKIRSGTPTKERVAEATLSRICDLVATATIESEGAALLTARRFLVETPATPIVPGLDLVPINALSVAPTSPMAAEADLDIAFRTTKFNSPP